MSILRIFSEGTADTESASALLEKLKRDKLLSKNDYKRLLEIAHHLLQQDLNNSSQYNLGLSIICHVSEYLPNDNFIKQLLYDCIAASRVFLYNEMLSNRNDNYASSIETGLFNEFAEAYYTLETDTVLTRDQKDLFDSFKEKRRIIVSAPTSFGKSRIIQEIIAHNSYNNVAVVLPTIALLNEMYLKFRANSKLRSYSLINSVNNVVITKKNIFILTPEKMDLFLDQNPEFQIDFFVMDEIYKIQDDIDRRKIFTHCLYRLSKQKNDFYLIGPYFKSFSKTFLSRTKSIFIQYTGEIVQKDTFDLSEVKDGDKYFINGKSFKKLKSKDRNLLNIISAIRDQTLVYVGRKDSVETRARKIADRQIYYGANDLIDYIKENISSEWSLVKCLEKGVAFHHSAIPRYIQNEIVDAFNDKDIDIIVCTSTLTEGVNTSAKNVIIFDNFKGPIELTGFDVKNIKGRAGRFYVHFLGNIYCLERLNIEADKQSIEFSYFDNKNLESEEVIQVDKSELTDQNLNLRKSIESQLKTGNIPFELVKNNKFIPLHNQILLIEYLRSAKATLDQIYFTGALPEKRQLEEILLICHRYIFSEADRENKSFPPWELVRQTKFYIYITPSLKALIQNQRGSKIDTKVRCTFSLVSHFFEFALPKYLTAFENIFNFVYKEFYPNGQGITLKYLITKLEFGFLNNHQIALKEAGLPNDIIQKIEKKFSDCKSLSEIRVKVRLNPNLISELSSFEKRIFNKYI